MFPKKLAASIVVTHYLQPRYLRNILGLVAGYGLLTVTGDEHRQMRKVMNPAFSIPNLMARTWDLFALPLSILTHCLIQKLICTTNRLKGK